MTIPLGDAKQLQERNACYQGTDLIVVSFSGGNAAQTANLGIFQADQNYTLRKIHMSLSICRFVVGAGTVDQIQIAWSRASNDMNTNNFARSQTLASLALTSSNGAATALSQMFDFTPDNIYLPKNSRLFLNSDTLSGTNLENLYRTSLYLLPTFV